MQDERDRVYDEKVVAADMLDFLKEFRIAHPSYFEAPLFVTGESYAGVPPICRLTQLIVSKEADRKGVTYGRMWAPSSSSPSWVLAPAVAVLGCPGKLAIRKESARI